MIDLPLVRTVHELRAQVAGWRGQGERIGLVPTMGALHPGHLSLVTRAKRDADRVIASIFVNPTQFGPNEDFAAYPRQLDEDARLLEAEGVDLLWAPLLDEVYPAGFATTVTVGELGTTLCGAARPGHFDGVATVVAKLFNQVRPDIAVFGEKDWQQLAIIRRMARDLDLTKPAAGRIVGVPIVREADGLAMSSRNRYLSPDDRSRAAALPAAMREAVDAIADGGPIDDVLDGLRRALLAAGFSSVDYAEVADEETLATLSSPGQRPARLFVAARIGGTRLIDNMPLRQPARARWSG